MEEEDPGRTPVEPAILVRGISKQYGKDPKVLDDLDMTVLKGTIYGLLGSSGCGKTTLLGSILGSRKIQKGAISILKNAPGVVPVKSIGYMPQDVALIEEFTIKRMLQHQGWIFEMTSKQIEERHRFYEKLLDLPPGNKLIKNLSGGQQRRVSLAVVLIQDPQLLILDEPTVGLDPVLRQNFWDYLIKITKEEKKTVVITTHYIEEARQANTIGLLRQGKMLAEGEPQILMNQFGCDSLENLFISLSYKQEERDLNISSGQNNLISKSDELKIFNQKPPRKSLLKKLRFTNRGHAKALMLKNFLRYAGSPSTLILVTIIPLFQIFCVFTAIGTIPPDLNIGIVNKELDGYRSCEDYGKNRTIGGHPVDEYGTCDFDGLGCKFARHFQKVVQSQVYFNSVEDALKAIKNGTIHQILFFPHNYSDAFTELSNFPDAEYIDSSRFVFYRDEIDNPLGLYIEKQLYTTYLKYAEELAKDCGWSVRSANLPIVFKEPIYGTNDFNYVNLIVPGTMILTLMTLAEALAIDTILSEKVGGVWERTIISGVTPAEILFYHTLTLCFVSAFQTVNAFLFAYYVFGIECKGNIFNALLLLYCEVLVGVALGIFFSVYAKNETDATLGALGIALPLLTLSGFAWPIQGMPKYLRYISYAMPTTLPIESFTNILFRGWGITNLNVLKGYLVTIGHICLYLIAGVLNLKFEKK